MDTNVSLNSKLQMLIQEYGIKTVILGFSSIAFVTGIIVQASIGLSGILTIFGVYCVLKFFIKKGDK